MKKSKFQLTLLFLTLAALVLLVGIQIAWIIKAARMQETQFTHSVNLAMNRIVENLSHEKAICKEVSNCLRAGKTGSCYILMKNREEWANIKSVIETDLKFYGINLDFEFDIVDANHESEDVPVKGAYLSDNLEEILEQSGFKLSIRFPEKRDFLIAQIGYIFVFSIVLLLIVTLSFIMIYRFYRKEKQLSGSIIDFVNNMTHEFKTPLANISLANNMISKNKRIGEDEKLSFYSDVIRTEHTKLKEKVDKLLKSSFTDIAMTINSEVFDAFVVAEDVMKSFNIQARNKGGLITINKSGTDYNIKGNPDQFHIAIGNIIDNAIKYCGEKPEISVFLKSSEKLITIEIEDNGPGIPKEYHEQVFDKYFRVSTGNVHEIDGFGLGLYHVKQITMKMGGKVKMTNLKGKGFRVSLEFPLVKKDE